ncbi:MAG: hypothetical protein ABIN01_21965 [Ferruginibacter sp.]
MDTSTEHITHRLCEERDKEAILQLWEEESGWGAITMEQFDTWFLNTPYGKCLIVVAENNDKIVGQIIYSPSRMIVDGQEIKTLRGSSPILSSDFRKGNIRNYDHPAFAMMRAGFDLAYQAGYQCVYAFPAYGWLGLLKLFPRIMPNPSDTASFDCFAIGLDTNQTFISVEDSLNVMIAVDFTNEYDALWEDAIVQMPVKAGIVRKAKWLKYIIGGHLVLETRSAVDNSLVGYMAINKKSGLMVDVFARNISDLEKVFQQAVKALHFANPQKIKVNFSKIKGMLTPVTQPIVSKIGYQTDPFRFAFGDYLLDTTIPFEKLAVSNWYMTPMG